VSSPAWNSNIFFRFDFTDFTLLYEELFDAPELEVEREPEVEKIISSSGRSSFVHPHFASFLLGLGFLWRLLLV
jgi:hypothetical protein